MSMSIVRLHKGVKEKHYLTGAFRNVIEQYLEYLKNKASHLSVEIVPMDNEKYLGDFYGLLASLKIPPEHRWITMRLNDLHSPMDYTGNLQMIKVINADFLDAIMRRYLNKQGYV